MNDLTAEEKGLLKGYLKFMSGFEESSLYEDYRAVETMTDDDYDKALDLIQRLANG